MSATLIAKGLAAGHGNHVLFSGLDLVIAPGEVTGVVGVNGAGKSTLLRLLAGLDKGALEQGSIALSPQTATVGYLPQEPDRRGDETVSDFIARRTGVARAQRDLDEAAEALAAGQAGADDAYSTALDRWLNLGGADLDERAEKVMSTLGLQVGLGRPTAGLSGGEAARANLASLLLSRYDVFLLDEPTNDLDIARCDHQVEAGEEDVVPVPGRETLGYQCGAHCQRKSLADDAAVTRSDYAACRRRSPRRCRRPPASGTAAGCAGGRHRRACR